jgi:hypothetical protein
MGYMIPVFQLCGISSVIHIIVINLCIASVISSPQYLINSAVIPPSPGALLFFVFRIHFSISSRVGMLTSSSSPITLLPVLVSSWLFSFLLESRSSNLKIIEFYC